jgi:ATP-dependent Clp protease ATP-binding subunit ClpA
MLCRSNPPRKPRNFVESLTEVFGPLWLAPVKVQLDTTAVEFLIDKGYDPTYGARPMRRAVEKYLEDPLAEEFLRGNIKQGDTLEVHMAGEQLAFNVPQAQQGEPANGNPLRSRG